MAQTLLMPIAPEHASRSGAVNPTTFVSDGSRERGRVALSPQGPGKYVFARRIERGEIVAIVPARFVKPASPFPPFRRLGVHLMLSSDEMAYLQTRRVPTSPPTSVSPRSDEVRKLNNDKLP